MLWSRF
jgi:hypothetical protein